MRAWLRARLRRVAGTRITRTLADYHDGKITWDEALAALGASPMATKPTVLPPTDSGADFVRWWNDIDDRSSTFPVDGTYDEVIAAVNRGWITSEQAHAVGMAQAALA